MLTLENILMSSSLPQKGLICLLEEGIDEDWSVDGRKEWEADELRNTDIGIVLREAALIPQMTVSQNIEIALRIQKWEGRSREDIRDRVDRVLTFVGLEHCEKVKASKLTARECRLVAFARALIKDPRILLIEEPKQNSNTGTIEEILPLLQQIAKTRLVVIVTEQVNIPGQADENSPFDLVACVQAGKIVKVQEKETKHKQNFALRRTEEMKAVREVEKTIPGRSDVRAKRLSLRDRICMSHRFGRKNRADRRGLIFLFMLMFLAAIVTLTAEKYNEQELITKYFNKYQPMVLAGGIESSYSEGGEEWKTLIKSGPYYSDRIRKVAEQTGKEAIPVITEQWLFTYEGDQLNRSYYDATFAALKENDPTLFPIAEGGFPKSEDEALISDYLAQVLQVSLGDPITSSMGEYRVCGIYSTDFTEHGVDTQLQFSSGTSAEQTERRYYYAVVVIDREALTARMRHAEWLKLTDAEIFENAYRDMVIAGTDSVSERDLLYGRMPQERDEILISNQMYLWNRDLFDADFLDQPFELVNWHAKEYNGYYSDSMNMEEFFPTGVKVVGVCPDSVVGYDPEYDTHVIDYRISDEAFEEIRQAYLSDYLYDGYLLNCVDVTDYRDLVQEATQLGYRFDESFTDGIHELKEMSKQWLQGFWLITAGLGVISVLCMMAHARISVRGNESEIRMLRSLGVSGKDFVSAFTFRHFMSAVRAAVYSGLIAWGAIWTLNFLIREGVEGAYIEVFDWQPAYTWTLIVGALVLTVTARVAAKQRLRNKKTQKARFS